MSVPSHGYSEVDPNQGIGYDEVVLFSSSCLLTASHLPPPLPTTLNPILLEESGLKHGHFPMVKNVSLKIPEQLSSRTVCTGPHSFPYILAGVFIGTVVHKAKP